MFLMMFRSRSCSPCVGQASASSAPSHSCLVTNTPSPSPQPPHKRQVMSPNPHDTLQTLQQQAAAAAATAAAASSEATAPSFVAVQMGQIAHQGQILIDESTLRQFQDSVALDSALLSDPRAAAVEPHDRLQIPHRVSWKCCSKLAGRISQLAR